MSWDFEDIAAALATRFGPGVVTAPTGLTPIQQSTHLLPENITELPAVYVFPFRPVSFEYDPMRRNGPLIWPVRFFFEVTALNQRISDLYQWAQVLYDQYPVSTSIDLGLGSYVYYASVESLAITTFDYGRKDDGSAAEWPVIQIDVLTQLGEALS